MILHSAYFSDGSILQAPRANQLKRAVAWYRQSEAKKGHHIKVWFRQCPAQQEAVAKTYSALK